MMSEILAMKESLEKGKQGWAKTRQEILAFDTATAPTVKNTFSLNIEASH